MIAFIKNHPILSNFLAMILLVIGVLVGVLFWLDYYTRHGEAEVVPDVRGVTVDVATTILAGKGMQGMVIDSVFRPTAAPGVVLEQNPIAGGLVKDGRRIYLIMNAKMAQMVSFPDVQDMSLRQAKVQIESAEFVIKEIVFEPSEYKDLVLAVTFKGDSVKATQKLPYRSEVVLHVGEGEKILATPDSAYITDQAVETMETIDEELPMDSDNLFGF